jgi:catechol 2,3-dioxygenase-like lactoylglutathione lyase family enzyme
MPGGLDHIAHAVRDLDAAAEFYQRAGFTVGARNRHPWGTHNRLVQLRDSYVEILEVAEPEKIPPHRARAFSFGAFHRDFIEHRQGLNMILLNSTDAVADNASFQTSGIGNFEVFDFAREGLQPDGKPVKLAFSLAFARDPQSPQVAFAICQHHFPENFWNAAVQSHANGTRDVLGAVMVADNPSDHHVFLKAFTGLSDLNSSSIGIKAHTANGDIEIMEPVSFCDQFGVSPAVQGERMAFNGLRFAVDDADQTEALLRNNGVMSRRRAGRVIVSPDVAFGATLIFESKRVD